MRKTMMSMGLGLALSLGTAGAAFAQSTQPAVPRDGSAQTQRAERGARGERGPGRFLLKGINLTDAQKAQLKQMRKDQKAQMKGSHDQLRKEMQDARALREKGDTVAAKAKFAELRTTMQQNRERQMAAIRGILTPDQQKTFDANVAQMKERAQTRMQKGQQGDRDWRGHKPNGK